MKFSMDSVLSRRTLLHGQCTVEENAEAFDSQREGLWYCQGEGC